MSASFVDACTARAADVDQMKGASTTTRLPYLAFATRDVQAKIRNACVLDARASPLAPFDLHQDGFTFVDRRSELSSLLPKIADPHNRPDVVRDAYPAVARFIEALGRQRHGGERRWRALTHSHMHRYTVQCPSFTVHNDYTHPDQGPKQAAKVIHGREAASEAAMKLPRTQRREHRTRLLDQLRPSAPAAFRPSGLPPQPKSCAELRAPRVHFPASLR